MPKLFVEVIVTIIVIILFILTSVGKVKASKLGVSIYFGISGVIIIGGVMSHIMGDDISERIFELFVMLFFTTLGILELAKYKRQNKK